MQEQQALLLEASPAYLAAISQDDKASCLNTAADAHDWELSHGQGTSSTALVGRAAGDAQGASLHYSRLTSSKYPNWTADVSIPSSTVTTSFAESAAYQPPVKPQAMQSLQQTSHLFKHVHKPQVPDLDEHHGLTPTSASGCQQVLVSNW